MTVPTAAQPAKARRQARRTPAAPAHGEVLRHAIEAIGGSARPGQGQMADAVADALRSGRHLLVQAGTGTGKSLGYLAPVLTSLQDGSVDRVVIATATLALQHQLAEKDIPAALAAVQAATKKKPSHAVLKGRTNYACLLRVRDGAADRDQGVLFGADQLAATIPPAAATADPESALGAEVLALREWVETQAEEHALADRDNAPTHTERGWAQVSIPVRECLGAQRCPWGEECFVERSREVARAADLVVTNHALLAIDAMHGGTALPEHDAVVIDEAHELVARVTGAASAELTPGLVERVGRRATAHLEDDLALDVLEAADELRQALDAAPLERVEHADAAVVAACAAVRGVTRQAVSALSGSSGDDPERRQVAAAMKEVFDIAERMARLADVDVVWVSENDRTGRALQVAPLTVAGLLRNQVFADRTVVLTSATLKLGGDFDGVAGSLGLRVAERDDSNAPDHHVPQRPPSPLDDESPGPAAATNDPAKKKDVPLPWRGLDVGSPFDYRQQGIRYVARDMDKPGRDGISEATLTEVAELVWAAGGRTLGLFSSRRAAEAAARHVRRQLPKLTVLCQGDAQLSELTRRFVAEETTSLFGTLSLWQGVDVPGTTCSLVIIDRIPFPRPDEPLTVARQRAVAESGGNGFMAVAATHAALLLAQGAGRLIRRTDDRGVVAVLDPRLVTARYGSFLQQSMPPMWPTTDREVAVGALRRLAGEPT